MTNVPSVYAKPAPILTTNLLASPPCYMLNYTTYSHLNNTAADQVNQPLITLYTSVSGMIFSVNTANLVLFAPKMPNLAMIESSTPSLPCAIKD